MNELLDNVIKVLRYREHFLVADLLAATTLDLVEHSDTWGNTATIAEIVSKIQVYDRLKELDYTSRGHIKEAVGDLVHRDAPVSDISFLLDRENPVPDEIMDAQLDAFAVAPMDCSLSRASRTASALYSFVNTRRVLFPMVRTSSYKHHRSFRGVHQTVAGPRSTAGLPAGMRPGQPSHPIPPAATAPPAPAPKARP